MPTFLSFVCSKLIHHKVGAGMQPGTFIVKPVLAERWEQSGDATSLFHRAAIAHISHQIAVMHLATEPSAQALVRRDVRHSQETHGAIPAS
jgi:hypothetical protein